MQRQEELAFIKTISTLQLSLPFLGSWERLYLVRRSQWCLREPRHQIWRWSRTPNDHRASHRFT